MLQTGHGSHPDRPSPFTLSARPSALRRASRTTSTRAAKSLRRCGSPTAAAANQARRREPTSERQRRGTDRTFSAALEVTILVWDSVRGQVRSRVDRQRDILDMMIPNLGNVALVGWRLWYRHGISLARCAKGVHLFSEFRKVLVQLLARLAGPVGLGGS